MREGAVERGQGVPEDTYLTALPDGGKHWRWLGGQKPPICERCKAEPAVVRYRDMVAGWECLLVLESKGGER